MSILTTTTTTTVGVEEDRWKTIWLRGGRIPELVWIGQDVLAWCSGLHVVFLDVPSNKVRVSNFERDVATAGVACLSGHLSHQIFAFAEKNPKPRISVYSYPSLTRICRCDKEKGHYPVAYLATAFAGDYLVSLSSIPDFKLTVWSWRTGDKIASVSTTICDAEDYGQILKANFSTPTFIAQLGNRCGKLCMWEMAVYGTSCIFNKNEVFLPLKKVQVKDVAWCPDSVNVLAIVDTDGNVYLSDARGDGIKRIIFTLRCGICVEIEPAAIAWHRGGIILRTTFCQIRYYRRAEKGDGWQKIWYQKSPYYPITLTYHPFRNDRLFFATREGHIVAMNLSDNVPNVVSKDVKYFSGGHYNFFDFLYPWTEYLVAVDSSKEISVINVQEGSEIVRIHLELDGNVTYMVSHLDYPLVIACSDQGEVVFTSFLRMHKPKILDKCRLQMEKLDAIRFSSSGRHMVVYQKALGVCYVVKISYDQSVSVVSRVKATSKIVDVILYDSEHDIKLCVLYNASHVIPIGQYLYVYVIHNGDEELTKATRTFFLGRLYRHIHCAPGGKSNSFVGTPYLTKQLRFFKTNDDWKNITCFDAIPSNHNVRQVKIHMSKKWLVTCGLDGSVNVKSASVKNRREKPVRFVTHHQCDLGVTRAVVNSAGDLLITLGNDGSLVATKLFESKVLLFYGNQFTELHEFGYIDFENHEIKVSQYLKTLDKNLIKFLSEPINILKDFEELDDFSRNESLTWSQWKSKQKLHKEKVNWSNKKEEIIMEFSALKNKINDLLDRNENYSEFNKLPISYFALDKTLREKKIKVSKDERAEVKLELELDCEERERIAKWIKKEYWDPQTVLAKSIFGICDTTEVANYTICAEKLGPSESYEYALFARNIFKELTRSGSISHWENYTISEIKLLFERQLRVKKTDEIVKIDKLVENEEESEIVGEENLVNKYALEGMTTRNFIEPCAVYYSQFRCYAFLQMLRDNLNNVEDNKNLRFYFNKQFDDMFATKEREMSLVRERIDRLHFISSELRTMFDEVVSETYEYPDWKPKEKPETIIKITDDELSMLVYVSPSQQELIDRKASEEERQRLALLADDFRERALQTMMDGVLEVRWEDLIKRELPKPECLVLGKPPDDYTDEEALAVKRYERDRQHLESERERYRKLLQTDYAKVVELLQEGIERFNTRLEEFQLLKMKVEAAVQQLNLRFVRSYVRHVKRTSDLNGNDEVRAQIKQNQITMLLISEEMDRVKTIEEELREQYGGMSAKDKLMEKKLKGEFTTLGKNAIGGLLAQYKRRPRTALKAATTAELLDLGKSITSMSKPPYLTLECLEYAKQLEILDVRPAALLPAVEATHWENLVALRRLKIDHELRQRAVSRDLEEAARALADNERRRTELSDACEALRNHLAQARQARIEDDLDSPLQLVLKMGQVEVEELRGDVYEDTARAVVVPRADIDAVNEAILKSGARKLRVMERALEFRRGILAEEWEHECLGTLLKHRGVELYYVRLANVTREIREYLSRKAKGQKDDKNAQRMNREFEAARRGQEKLFGNWKTKAEYVSKEILRVQRKNDKLDDKIKWMNVDRCEMELKRDVKGEKREKDFREKILKLVMERSAILRKLKANYEELLEMREKQKALRSSIAVPVQYIGDDASIDND